MQNEIENPNNQLTSGAENLSPEMLLEKEKQETLKLQLEVLNLQSSLKSDSPYRKALDEFHNLSNTDKMKMLYQRKRSSKPADVFWQRTVWYIKPVITKGKLQGTKIVPLVYCGQWISKADVEYIESIEKEYEELNAKMRKQNERKKDDGSIEKLWFMDKPIQNTQTIEKNEGIQVG